MHALKKGKAKRNKMVNILSEQNFFIYDVVLCAIKRVGETSFIELFTRFLSIVYSLLVSLKYSEILVFFKFSLKFLFRRDYKN